MPMVREPETRQTVFTDAMLAVRSVSRGHSVLHVQEEAKRLLHDHVDCAVSLGELEGFLTRFAVRQHVAIEIC